MQDFKPGFSLLRESDRYHEMNVLNTIAVNRMKSVGKLLAGLHNISIAHIPNHSNAVRRSQREMLTHPQITLDVLSCYPHDHAIL